MATADESTPTIDRLPMQSSTTIPYGSGSYTRKKMFDILAKVAARAKTYGVRAYMSETAVHSGNPTATAFLADILQITSVLGIDTTLHAYKEAPQWDYEPYPAEWAEVIRWLDRYDANLDSSGIADPIVWEETSGNWFYRLTSEGYSTIHVTGWGAVGNVPFAGNFNGQGAPDFVVYQGAGYPVMWALNYDYTKSYGQTTNYEYVQWGLPGDLPVPGDYDGNGVKKLAVWRPSEGNWYIRDSSTSYHVVQWGLNGDYPYPDDYDFDGTLDLAVWRPSNSHYYLIPSSGSCPAGTTVHGIGCDKAL